MDDKTRPDETGYRFIGKPMPRKEDARLITGKGQFTDDFSLDGQTYAVMVRSPYPHARIVAIDAAAAKKMPGVLGVFTGADCSADKLAPIPHDPVPKTKFEMKPTAPGRYTLYAGSGGAVRQKSELSTILGVSPDNVRVLSHDVGGNFGTRNRVFVEFGLVLWASRKIGRPVKFTATRSEAFLSDYQGRDLVTKVELALDAKHRFIAMRATNISNVGARCVSLSPLSKGAGLIPGSYAIPATTLRAMAVFTNTMPTNAYRSSGRPEVTFAIEHLVDAAAAQLGVDRIELRRKNLVAPKAMPYRNSVGMLYDSGRYAENMDWAMDIADWKGFAARRREAKRRGKLLGLGLANYVESSIGAPREQARIKVQPDGRVDVVIGTQPAGQGK